MTDYSLEQLLILMARLRDPVDGCPWDQQQDFSSIVPHTLEESYELADAIADGDFQHIKEELGDLLFQVVFYARLGEEQGQFDFSDVISALVGKLLRRHPHVFPSGELASRRGTAFPEIDAIKANWEAVKASEREDRLHTSLMDDIPQALPAINRATKMQKRAARVGFDWIQVNDVLNKISEELQEVITALAESTPEAIQGEIGDLLFSCVNLARHLDIDAEMALRGSNRKFESRFRYIEDQLLARDCAVDSADEELMDALWEESKKFYR